MIVPEHLPELQRWAPYYKAWMLMLGATESKIPGHQRARSWFQQYVGDGYHELDLADGDLRLDLNLDLAALSGRYATVFDLGAIEQVWDVHRAYCNALRAVEIGGHFLCHAPVGGWQDAEGLFNHGNHMTRASSIVEFCTLNGFEVRDLHVTRWKDRGRILWLAAEKIAHVEEFKPVMKLRGFSSAGYRGKP